MPAIVFIVSPIAIGLAILFIKLAWSDMKQESAAVKSIRQRYRAGVIDYPEYRREMNAILFPFPRNQ